MSAFGGKADIRICGVEAGQPMPAGFDFRGKQSPRNQAVISTAVSVSVVAVSVGSVGGAGISWPLASFDTI
jgi:hypothetical protein